jgi:hypothetical protein
MTNFVSITEAARITGYNPDYIRQLIRAGKVVAQKTVTVWQIDLDDLWRHKREQQKERQR